VIGGEDCFLKSSESWLERYLLSIANEYPVQHHFILSHPECYAKMATDGMLGWGEGT
jgi:hypothetical protein